MGGEAPKTLDVAERTAWLAEQIAHHSHLYYNLAQPELSDAEFDRLWTNSSKWIPTTHN